MSLAIITHSSAFSSDGGTYTTANVWQQAPLTEIISQINPDGTLASFCTLLANQFTLVAGVYRFSGFRVLRNSNTTTSMHARLYNVTAAAAAFVGLANEATTYEVNGDAHNHVLHFGDGTLILGGTTTFEIQGIMSNSQSGSGFGLKTTVSSPVRNLFSSIRILKTA